MTNLLFFFIVLSYILYLIIDPILFVGGDFVSISEIRFRDITNNMSLLNHLFDIIRIVDPITKKVMELNDELQMVPLKKACYEFWGRNQACTNCISARVLNEKGTYVKIEYNEEKMYMVTAVPLEMENGKFAVEFLKEITHIKIKDKKEGYRETEIYQLLSERNTKMVKDELTDIYNKRYILERLPYEIINSIQKEQYLSIIMADIDHFKKVNDTIGHLGGDYVLKEFAKQLQEGIRSDNDWVARYGGEEFLICINNVNASNAYKMAERFREKVEKMELCYQGKSINITASFGVCTIYKQEVSLEQLIDCADSNLYKAKQEGRNQVIGSNP